MTTDRPSPQHGVTQDIPLPGFYPCLTLQLNVTRYQAEGIGRFVLVVREPSAGVEVKRAFQDIGQWSDITARVLKELDQALIDLVWLQKGKNM